ncbi:MAG TPA: histidine kinase [Acidothermaceae bacterium]|jgi:signal transduction histidine kinase
MLATLNWLIRATACALIGVLTFATSSSAHGNHLAFEIAAYAISLALVAAWLVADVRQWQLSQTTTAVGMGVLAAVAGAACNAPNGGALIGFAAVAALAGGADTGLLAGSLVTCVGILAAEVGAIAFNASTAAVVGYPLIVLSTFIAGRNRRGYKMQAEQSQSLLEQSEQLRTEQRNVAVLDERNRIAREIHDVLAHSLGALGIQIQAVRAVLTDDGDVERAVSMLTQAQRMASDGLVETRRAVQALRGDATRLDEQITNLAQTHRERHGTAVEFSIEGEPTDLTPEATVAFIRTAQEALVNAAKHAPHQPVQVVLSYNDDAMHLAITNPLERSDGAAPLLSGVNGGYGLTGMRERLLLIRGTLSAGPEGECWAVRAQVPR